MMETVLRSNGRELVWKRLIFVVCLTLLTVGLSAVPAQTESIYGNVEITWADTLSGGLNFIHKGIRVVTDPDGNALVLNRISGAFFQLTKFAVNGVEQWRRYGVFDESYMSRVNDLVVDNAGRSFIVGEALTSDGIWYMSSMGASAYDADGDRMWSDGQMYAFGKTTAAALNPAGDLVAVGSDGIFKPGIHVFTIRNYRADDGRFQWEAQRDRNYPAQELVVDEAGNSYAIGGYREFYVAKADAEGSWEWTYTLNDGEKAHLIPVTLAVTDDRVYVGGEGGAPSGHSTGVFVALSPESGAERWLVYFVSPEYSDTTIVKVAAAPNGDVIVGGMATKLNGDQDIMLVRITKYGQTVWSKYYDGGENDTDTLSDMIVGDDGSIYLVGGTRRGMYDDAITAKIGPAGRLIWAADYGGSARDARALSIDLVGEGGVYVTGRVAEHGFVIRYDEY
ncbi:MAG: hypothetical protein P9L99_13020 [Candidatus Lernaella stagnicola]|nr:hypothetical protein [Candidatus Lernaella stagnicola]